MDIYNNTKETKQNIYDYYNNYIFSNDSRVFNKMTKRIELYLQTKNLVGDIWEIGVFKGSGVSLWLKLKNMYEYNSPTKIVGVDYFEPDELLKNLENDNNLYMSKVLERVNKDDLNINNIKDKLNNINDKDIILLKGDASITCKKYVEKNLGVRIKILYMDLDLGEPTYNVLKNLWSNVIINGIIVFDEYAYHCWDESIGVDKFLKEIPNQYKIYNTHINAPTMFIKKIC